VCLDLGIVDDGSGQGRFANAGEAIQRREGQVLASDEATFEHLEQGGAAHQPGRDDGQRAEDANSS
jgi:hypothetical protein